MSITTIRVRTGLARQLGVACGAVVLLLAASACGSGNAAVGTSGQTTENGVPQGQQQGGPVRQIPGADGKVAAVQGSTAQVQSEQNGQVAVSWTAGTTFTRQVRAKLADIKVGDCVVVAPADQTASGSTTPPTTVTAASVRITPKVDGACGFAGRDGGPQVNGGPQGGGQPPSGAPSGGSRPQMRGFGGAVGDVTAVAANSFAVSSQMPGSSTRTTVTVTVGSTTTYTTTAKGTASDVKVGVCVLATGSTDSTGAVTARTIAISQPENGQCGGFVRFRAGDGAGNAQQES